MKALRITAAFLACALLTGCASLLLPASQAAGGHQIAFRRVILVEFGNKSPYGGTGRRFTKLLRDELAAFGVAADFVVVERKELLPGDTPLTTGRISLKSLVRARKKFLADVVVVGVIENHNPYWKPSVQVNLKVINTGTGALECELARSWDAGSKSFQRELKSYYNDNYGRDEYGFGPELFVISEHHFLKFVAHSLAEELLANI